ncbi:MAG: AEC family transporter [Fusicatenibacter sp.]|nr:AEC family transporter [Fusicatenibacter sp.]
MSTGVVLQQMMVIFLLILTGLVIYQKGIVSYDTSRQISALITNVCNPALMIASVFSDEMTATRGDVLATALIAFAVYVIMIAAGCVVPLLLRVRREERKYYNLMMVYGNTGFIGIPVVTALLGEGAVIYVTVFNFFYNICIYTHGIVVLNSGAKNGNRFCWKKLINIGTLSSVLAVFLFWFEIPLPGSVVEAASYIGKCTTFLSMIVLGISVARTNLRRIFGNGRLYLFTAIRMVAFPILVTLALKPFVTNPTILAVTLLLTSMPVGNMPLMLAQEQGEEAETLANGIILTTLLSLITITITTRFL